VSVATPVEDGAELARGAFVNTLAMVASNFRGVFTFLVARLLGRATLGIFTIAWATTDLLSKIGVFGLDNSLTTFIARAEAAGDRDRSRSLFRIAVWVSLSLSAVVAAVTVAAARWAGSRLGQPPEVIAALTIVIWAMPGLALYKVGTAASRGMKVMRHDVYSRGLTETIGTTLAFLVVLALGARASAPEIAAIGGTLAAGLVAVGLAASLFSGSSRSNGRGIRLQAESVRLKPDSTGAVATTDVAATNVAAGLVAYAAPIAGYDLLNTVIMNLDVVLLGLFIGRAPGVTLVSVGVYAAAVDVASGLRKVSQLFTPIFAPVVAAMAAGTDDARAVATFARLRRWTLAILMPLVAVLTLGGEALLSIYGPGFRDGRLWLGIVALACATNAFVSLGEVVIMVRRPRLNLLNSTVTCIVTVGASLWLIPRFGITGAAIGILLPYVIQGILRDVELRYLFGWPSHWHELGRPVAAAAAAALPAVGCRVMLAGIPGQLAAIAAFLAVYAGAWWLFGLDPGDRAIVDSLIGRATPLRSGEAYVA
jgi:O-antigen/teichoic acid export membrane protein